MSFDRFKGPCASDDISNCNNCGERKHYTALDDDGFCQDCQPEPKDDDEESD
jgi:hypothetical protein